MRLSQELQSGSSRLVIRLVIDPYYYKYVERKPQRTDNESSSYSASVCFEDIDSPDRPI